MMLTRIVVQRLNRTICARKMILDGIMLILWLGLPSETSGLLAVDICEIQVKLGIFGDIPRDLRVWQI